jgi:serine/threonine-protein kinase HipA
MSPCDAFGMLPTQAAVEVVTVIDNVNSWQKHFAQIGVTARDIASLSPRIDGEALLSQRMGFNPAQFQTSPAKRKRPSPFRRH